MDNSRSHERLSEEIHQGGTDLSSSLNTAQIEPDQAETVSSHKTYKERMSLALKKRRAGEPLNDDEQRIIDTYDKYNAKRNARISEIRRKRRAGEPLTEEEQRLIQ